MPKKSNLKELLEEVDARRFEVGDAALFRTVDGSGYKSVVADEGGFEVRLGNQVITVTDSMLEEAINKRDEKEKQKAPRWDPLDELPAYPNPPEKTYYCNCKGVKYKQSHYDSWVKKMSATKDCPRRTIGHTIVPVDWPEHWVDGLCNQCHSAIMVKRSG